MKNIKLYSLIIIILIVFGNFLWHSSMQITENLPSKSEISDTVKLTQADITSRIADISSKIHELSAYTESETKYSESLCANNEEVLLSFKLAGLSKILSVCVSKTQPEYIVYRFGIKDKIELEFPENKDDSWSKFTYSYYFRGGESDNEGMDLNYLFFEDNGQKYEIYQEYIAKDNITSIGVKITDMATNKETEIKGLSNSIEGSLLYLRGNEKIKIHQN